MQDTVKPAGKEPSQKSLTERLVAALQQEEYTLYAQTITPVVKDSEPRPFQEIFVRFKEEDENLLPPGSFLLTLAECDLLPYLDRWVINRLARWVRAALRIKPDWEVPSSNVNLSVQTLIDPEFPQYVHQYVNDSFLSGGALGFEISWNDAVAHGEAIRRLMSELRPYGCHFTFSDFDGSEQSFETLKTFEPDFVKLSSTSVDPTKVAEINRKCHASRCKTIVEHVESGRVLEHLRQVSVDFVQGLGVSPVQAL
jgi:EAL domain-containing protein (putative c-di-GMP-specific phosphodiesterase class I)